MRLEKKNSINKRNTARLYSEQMKNNPSALEVKMQEFLDNQGIIYEFQKVFHIKNKFKNITHFYIADFYIPSKNLIIETDGAFHKNQVKKDNNRTHSIQKHYPHVKVIRWQWNDFYSYSKMKELVSMIT